MTNDKKAIAIYNSDIPELVAIFDTQRLAAKYFKPDKKTVEKMETLICNSSNRKIAIGKKSNRFGFRMAIRKASSEQMELLGEKRYVMCVDYLPEVSFNFMLEFKLNRIAMSKTSTIAHPKIRKII